MSEPTTDEILALARELGSQSLLARVEEDLADDNIRGARTFILGHLDAAAEDQPHNADQIAVWYQRLGFSISEATSIRQNASLDSISKNTGA